MAKKKKNNISWSYYFLELMVVFIGVSAGFLMNNWRSEQKESEVELMYLQSFKTDLLEEQKELDSLIIRSTKKEELYLDIFKASLIINQPLTDSLAQILVVSIMSVEWFTPSNDTYEDIKNSGNLNLISDYHLKEEISSYYKFIEDLKSVEGYYISHMNSYGFPILYKTYHLFNHKFVSEESYKSLEFTNMYLAAFSLLQGNKKVYKTALERNKELLLNLDVELE